MGRPTFRVTEVDGRKRFGNLYLAENQTMFPGVVVKSDTREGAAFIARKMAKGSRREMMRGKRLVK